jgi:sugar phosphate isomerase/epimerase
MFVGIQTISFGPSIAGIPGVLDQLAELGFAGIELAQQIHDLETAEELAELLAKRNLRVAGLSGGSLLTRIPFAIKIKPDYLYCDAWEEDGVRLAKESHLTVALHPFVFKEMGSISAAEQYLRADIDLKLIVDTAHSYLAGDDPVDIVRRYSRSNQLAAVHIKDWTSVYGRSPYTYSRGFVPLGEGELGHMISEVLKVLESTHFNGWVLVEQDSSDINPVTSAQISRHWLRGWGL